MPDDPLLPYYGHPILPAGFNSAPNDGDEVDGPGYNEPVWPYLFNAFIPLEVLIVTPDMLEVFDGCPDFIADGPPSPIVVPPEQMTYTLPEKPSTYVPTPYPVYFSPAVINTIVFPPEQRTLVLTEEGMVK